jgi:hypothetical protein
MLYNFFGDPSKDEVEERVATTLTINLAALSGNPIAVFAAGAWNTRQILGAAITCWIATQ